MKTGAGTGEDMQRVPRDLYGGHLWSLPGFCPITTLPRIGSVTGSKDQWAHCSWTGTGGRYLKLQPQFIHLTLLINLFKLSNNYSILKKYSIDIFFGLFQFPNRGYFLTFILSIQQQRSHCKDRTSIAGDICILCFSLSLATPHI